MARISVVIPVYNSESCLDELFRRLVDALGRITANFQIVLVEDRGTDNSWAKIETYARADARVYGLRFSRNFGQHHAIAAGLDHCDGDFVVIMDCDLQDSPEDIARFYERALQGYDVVLARRIYRSASWHRVLTARAFAVLFTYLTERKVDSRVGAFRMLSRRVVEAYRQLDEKIPFLPGAVAWLGFPTTTIDIEQHPRFAGNSGYNLRKLVGLAAFSVIAYSDKPLRLAIKFGFACAAISWLVGVALVFDHLFGGQRLPGWSSIIVSIYLVGGLIIACIGIVGAYVSKIFDLVRGRPSYLIAAAIPSQPTLKHYFAEPVPGSLAETKEETPHLVRVASSVGSEKS
jgi:dolichol-phosphate mannosyltransferase